MNKLKLTLPVILVFLVGCLGQVKQSINIPIPKVKSQIKISLNTITNISKFQSYELNYFSNIILSNILYFDFSKIEEESTLSNMGITNTENQNTTNQNQTTSQTNFLEENEKHTIDINKIVEKTLRRNFSSFVRSLGKVSIKPEEIQIQNLQDIEKVIIEKTKPETSNMITNFITNYLYETNYTLSKENSNKVLVQIIEKEEIIQELKLNKDFVLKTISNTTPWIFRITNNITFTENKPEDFSVNIFWKLEPKKITPYLTNFFINLTLVISNNIKSNFTIFETNLAFEDFLLSDHKLFSEIRPFLYNFNSGILIVDIRPKEYDIYVDDFLFGKEVNEYFSEGIHKITLSKGSYTTNEYVYIQNKKLNLYKKDISKEFENMSKIKITSFPSGADIFIESEYYGKTPTEIVLPYGKYRIKLSKNSLKKFLLVEISQKETELSLTLDDLNDKTKYNIATGITTLLGTLTLSSIFLYFWADNQERYYNFLYSKENKQEYWNMKTYYYYFKDNMRTTAITGSILTLITWGITLGIESDKFFIKTHIKF